MCVLFTVSSIFLLSVFRYKLSSLQEMKMGCILYRGCFGLRLLFSINGVSNRSVRYEGDVALLKLDCRLLLKLNLIPGNHNETLNFMRFSFWIIVAACTRGLIVSSLHYISRFFKVAYYLRTHFHFSSRQKNRSVYTQ